MPCFVGLDRVECVDGDGHFQSDDLGGELGGVEGEGEGEGVLCMWVLASWAALKCCGGWLVCCLVGWSAGWQLIRLLA